MSFICKVIIEPFNICLFQRRYRLRANLITNECLIHILIVFKGIVFKTSFQVFPKLIHIIEGSISSFCLYAVFFIFFNLLLFVAKLIECLGIYITPFAICIRPTIMICTVCTLVILLYGEPLLIYLVFLSLPFYFPPKPFPLYPYKRQTFLLLSKSVYHLQ